jgi:D-glycero-D-manno-heptose 1,7-bisphosphate phosphatase
MCPDSPDAPSKRRKPEPGMVLDAAQKLGLDLTRSWMIGDKAADVECGRNAGIRSVQVRTGEGELQRTELADYFAEDFADAVDFILRSSAGGD